MIAEVGDIWPGRSRKSTRPGANGVVELSPFEFLDRLAELVPPPRKHRHRYHGVFAPNHKLRRAVTALAKRQRRHAARGRCRRAWGRRLRHGRLLRREPRDAKATLARHITDCLGETHGPGEEFPLECPACGGDIRLIAFITEPGAIRKILTHLGEPLEPPPVSPARGPPTDWVELVQAHDDRDVYQASPDELPVIDIYGL